MNLKIEVGYLISKNSGSYAVNVNLDLFSIKSNFLIILKLTDLFNFNDNLITFKIFGRSF